MLREIVLGLSMFSAGCIHSFYPDKFNLGQDKSTRETYEERIEYLDLKDLDKIKTSSREIRLPWDLNYLTRPPSFKWLVKDKELFNKEIDKKFLQAKRRYDLEGLSLEEALVSCGEIVSSILDYKEMDENGLVPLEECLISGFGDCDKYAHLYIEFFNKIREINSHIKNVYLTTTPYGGLARNHAWITLLLFSEERIFISHIDPTFYDSKGILEGTEGYHFNKKELISNFYKYL